MKLGITLTLLITFIVSCANINRESREKYSTHTHTQFRHGIIPITNVDSNSQKIVFSSDSIKKGKILYKNNCLSCHGSSGRGDGQKANASKLLENHSYE